MKTAKLKIASLLTDAAIVLAGTQKARPTDKQKERLRTAVRRSFGIVSNGEGI